MNKKISISIVVLLLVTVAFWFYKSTNEVRVLDKYDFHEGEWVLIKGYYGDSIQYIMTDVNALNDLKDDWVLYKSSQNFATTGGYNVGLYHNKSRKMYMDIINDGEWSQSTSGILYHSDLETLEYDNLDWLNAQHEHWKKVRAVQMEFKTLHEKTNYLDSIKSVVPSELTIISESKSDNAYYIYYVYEIR